MQQASSTSPQTRIYAIGDIHGREDLLALLLNWIEGDVQSAGSKHTVLVFLGDYVDRGPHTPDVLERLIAGFTFMQETVFLRGNHEETLLNFLNSEAIGWSWFKYGGLETLQSYGVAVSADLEEATACSEKLSKELSLIFPPEHKNFLQHLEIQWSDSDYMFVHAGVRPGVALVDQSDYDMMWIRDDFLNSSEDFGKIIVHGHTIEPDPVIKVNRIGIDTGAFESDRLSCLVLEDNKRRIVYTNQGKVHVTHFNISVAPKP